MSKYESKTIVPIEVEPHSLLFAGSVQDPAITIIEVAVRSYGDGFDGASRDEWEIGWSKQYL